MAISAGDAVLQAAVDASATESPGFGLGAVQLGNLQATNDDLKAAG